jgi:hypothetical protein
MSFLSKIIPRHFTLFKVNYDLQSIGQSVLVSVSHLKPVTRFILSDDFCILDTLSEERGCPIASGPCQSSHSSVKVPQNWLPDFTVSFEAPPTWRARSPYLYPPPPRNRLSQLYPRALGSLFVASYDSLSWVYFTAAGQSNSSVRLSIGLPCRAHDQILSFL